ncbi:AAA family ATPase [Brachybacterium paraconglomeratum]
MITRIKARNYRCYPALDFKPHRTTNILVGGNESGKSTLLEIISLLITGKVNGRWAADELNPYWFNQDSVEAFYEDLLDGKSPDLPTIELELYLESTDGEVARLRGMVNSEKEDTAGIRMTIQPAVDSQEERDAYFAGDNPPHILPSDLYAISWKSFAGETITRQPRGLGLSVINAAQTSGRTGVESKVRELVRDFVTPTESANIALAHRKLRAQLDAGILGEVNRRVGDESENFELILKMDQSANSRWETSVSPHVGTVPFSMLGRGRQVATQIALAMARSADRTQFVLIEEPENHLSHIELQKLLDSINALAAGRQTFIATHSSYVLNRLGFDSLQLVGDRKIVQLSSGAISEDTVRFFQKQPGFDTLRLAVSKKVVIVEGPSDEMLFNLAFKHVTGSEPRDKAIDVIPFGIRGKRALELAKSVGTKVAVLRDNDGSPPDHWRKQAGDLISPGKQEMFIGDTEHGRTLEYQVSSHGNESALKHHFELEAECDVTEYMLENKTEWAWRIADGDVQLNWPGYIRAAIEFIDAD